MTAPAPLCPGCATPLTGSPACPACGLRLAGPDAHRLWQVDLRLAALTSEQRSLLAERTHLLTSLRGDAPALPVRPAAAVPAREAKPQQVQNTLLGLGALLLALAGVVFAAVTYQSLGAVGRALVLTGLTAAAGAATPVLLRRRLTASAEAVGAVAAVLAVLTAGSLRRAGLGDGLDLRTYCALASGVLALAGAGWAVAVPLRTARLSSALLAQLPVPLALWSAEVSWPVAAVGLALLAGADAAVATRRLPGDLRLTLLGLGGLAATGTLVLTALSVEDGARAAGAGLLVLAAIATVGAVAVPRAREVLSAAAVVLLGGAAWASARPSLEQVQEPLIGVAVALLALQVAAMLPRRGRVGTVVGAALVLSVALAAELEPLLLAVAGPLTWLSEPWTLTATSARDAVLPDESWTGSGATVAVTAAAALAVPAIGHLVGRLRDAVVPTVVLLALSGLVLPLGLDTGYRPALAVQLGAAALLVGAGVALRQPAAGITGVALACVTAAWSAADREATLVVLPVAAVLAAVLAVRLAPLAGVAALLAGAEVAAAGAAQGLQVQEVGALLLAAPAVCVALSFVLRGEHRLAVEVAAGVLALVAVVCAGWDADWLAAVLAGAGVLALAVAVRPDRRVVGVAGAVLLSASSWVRLADAGVTAPEPYVLPAAVLALVLGHLRRSRTPGVSSMTAYAPGLTAALVPTLLKGFTDTTATRSLVLLAVCVVLVLMGVRDRLRAPLAVGGVVLVADAVHLLAPYAAALPRWSVLATGGVALVVVGATYERRRQDVVAWRERFDALG